MQYTRLTFLLALLLVVAGLYAAALVLKPKNETEESTNAPTSDEYRSLTSPVESDELEPEPELATV